MQNHEQNSRWLQENERLARMGSWEFDVASGVVYFSQGLNVLCGISDHHQNGVYSDLVKLIHPKDYELFIRKYNEWLKKAGLFSLRIRLITSDFAILNVLFHGESKSNSSGVVERIICTVQDISEQVLIEQALLKDKTVLETLIENTDSLSWSLDERYNIVTLNGNTVRTFKDLFGTLPIKGKSLLDLFPEANKITWKGYFDRALQGRHFKVVEQLLNHEAIIYFEISFYPVYSENVAVGVSCFARDITERKESERVILESEARFRSLFANTPIAYQAMDHEGVILDINENWETLFWFLEDEVVGKRFAEFLSEDSSYLFLQYLSEISEVREVRQAEFQMIDGNKNLRWIELTSNAQFDIEGRFLRSHCIVRDITDSKLSSEALEQSFATLEAQIENSPNPIWSMDRNYSILAANHNFSNWFQKNYGVLLKPNDNMMECLTGEQTLFWKELFEKAFDGNLYKSVLRIDNSYTEISLNPIRVVKQVVGVSCVCRDITEHIVLEKQLSDAKEKAETSNLLKSRFLANMSHEIRTPMNAIMGFAEVLKDKIPDPSLNIYVSTIYNSSKGLLALVNDILDISLMEAGELEIKLQPVSIKPILTEVAQFFSRAASDSGISLQFNIPLDFPTQIEMDELRFKQILNNLIGNGIKFTNRGGFVACNILFEPVSNGYVALSVTVEDSGIGIGQDQLQRIFEMFVQEEMHDNRKYGGTGLGLSITKRIVELLGGSISVESKQNVGSKFKIVFPRVKVLNDREPVENHKLDGAVAVRFENMRAVILDNNPENTLKLSSLLDRFAIPVFATSKVDDAIEVCRREKPHFVFFNGEMVDVNYATFTTGIKEIGFSDYILIAIVTKSGLRHENVLRSFGVHDILHFPYDMESISKMLESSQSKIKEVKPPALPDKPAVVERRSLEALYSNKELCKDLFYEIGDNYFITNIGWSNRRAKELAGDLLKLTLTHSDDEFTEFVDKLVTDVLELNILETKGDIDQLAEFISGIALDK